MRKLLRLLAFLWLLPGSALFAQQRTVSGTVVADDDNAPLQGVSVTNRNSGKSVQTNNAGYFSLAADKGNVLVFTYVGYARREVTVGDDNTIGIKLTQADKQLGEVVVTALGIQKNKRSLGYATSDVKGDELAQTQRDNFLNAIAGRVPGVTITGTSGMPGSSTSIIIRGINSISGSNQPLFIVDGLPMDNTTFSSGNLVSDRPGSANALSNRTVDFSNRISDINPDDIESITILKGPEAAALYGIDAANGAIIITTKKGKAGVGTINYSVNVAVETVGRLPKLQRVYGQGTNGITNDDALSYFGPKYPDSTIFFDNVANFFQTGVAHRHNLSFEGGADKYTYRLSTSYGSRQGVVPNTRYDRLNVGLFTTAQIKPNFKVEANLQYFQVSNKKVSKGNNSFLLALLTWPANEDVRDYLLPNGARKRISASSTEIENPFFDVNKNQLRDKTDRVWTNVGLIYDPFKWLTLTTRVGLDVYSTDFFIAYHPESNRSGGTIGGSLDISRSNLRNLTVQYFATLKKRWTKDLYTTFRVGSALYDFTANTVSSRGESFLAPEFFAMNNTDPVKRLSLTYKIQKRLVGVFGDLNINFRDYLYLTFTGRNDFSSTLPPENQSFFYPSASLSYVFTDMLSGNSKIKDVLSFGKLRASIAQVGKDARPYAIYPSLESQLTTAGGYAYGFTAPNLALEPEKVTSYEFGTELRFLNDRIGLDVAYYKSRSVNQIVRDLRISYGTGFVLKDVNGGKLENSGLEISLNGKPVAGKNFRWESIVNFTKTNSKLVALSGNISEFYNSDTWLFANVRNGARLGQPLTTFTARFSYEYNNKGQLLINPANGLPVQVDNASWPIAGDRNPDFMLGFNNTFTYKNLSLSFLVDVRKGGDVFNATGLYLYLRGLHEKTFNREDPMVFTGVLKDGKENTDNPTVNTIQLTPYTNNTFYSGSTIDQEFIERDVNWLRLRDVTIAYRFTPEFLKKVRIFKSMSVGFTATDLLMISNYTGGDPGVNGTTTASGGSGGSGFDYGNLPISPAYNFTFKVSL